MCTVQKLLEYVEQIRGEKDGSGRPVKSRTKGTEIRIEISVTEQQWKTDREQL